MLEFLHDLVNLRLHVRLELHNFASNSLDLFFGLLDVLLSDVDLVAVNLFLLLLDHHVLSVGSKVSSLYFLVVSVASAAVLDGGNVLDVLVRVDGLILLEGHSFGNFIGVFYFLKLQLVGLDLLFKVFHTFGH